MNTKKVHNNTIIEQTAVFSLNNLEEKQLSFFLKNDPQ